MRAIEARERMAKRAVEEPRLMSISRAMMAVTRPRAFSGTRMVGET